MEESPFVNNAIFWVEIEKIAPNPYQPRREFDQARLNDLAESIRQYGVLQPLVVTRHEMPREDGGLSTHYELLAGERRLRASKLAGLSQVPVMIKTDAQTGRMKLEIAIIENLQREDLNPLDRASAFERLVKEFDFTHTQVAQKIGKSRVYVANTLRILALPEEIKQAVAERKISEGHTRPLLMLSDRPEEQATLFKEIVFKQINVRDAEAIARRIAQDRVRNKRYEIAPEVREMETQLSETLGTRVRVEQREVGGRIVIDFFSNDDLAGILTLFHSNKMRNPDELLNNYIKNRQTGVPQAIVLESETPETTELSTDEASAIENEGGDESLNNNAVGDISLPETPLSSMKDTEVPEVVLVQEQEIPQKDPDEDLYSVRNFTI